MHLHKFHFFDTNERVQIRVVRGGAARRATRSAVRRAVFASQSFPSKKKWTFGDATVDARRFHRKVFLDGHYEHTEIARAALSLGLAAPFELIEPSPAYRDRLRSLRSDAIAIHVRLGDYRTWREGRYVLGSDYYSEALAALGTNPKDAVISVFSDEPPAARELLQNAGVHGDRIQISGLTCPAEEFSLLARHRRQILSHSTFAMWAGLTSPSALHVAPAPAATMTAPEGWLTIPIPGRN